MYYIKVWEFINKIAKILLESCLILNETDIFNPNNLASCTFLHKKYIHVNIFHNNGTAMVSSQLFLTHVLMVI